MKRLLSVATCVAVLAVAPVAIGIDRAGAIDWDDVAKGIVGGVIAGAVIGTIVRAGQQHCHQGLGCHSHGYADPYHYHRYVGGPILYQRVVAPAPPPPPVASPYPPVHYQWCSRYRTFDPASNTYIRTVGGPRVPCISPYIR